MLFGSISLKVLVIFSQKNSLPSHTYAKIIVAGYLASYPERLEQRQIDFRYPGALIYCKT